MAGPTGAHNLLQVPFRPTAPRQGKGEREIHKKQEEEEGKAKGQGGKDDRRGLEMAPSTLAKDMAPSSLSHRNQTGNDSNVQLIRYGLLVWCII